MAFKFIVFILMVLTILFGAHFLFYLAIVRFFAVSNHSARTALFVSLSFLSLTFMASFFLIHFWENLLTRSLYIFSASWLGLFVNLLLALGSSWLLLGIIRLLGYNPNSRPVAIVFFAMAVFYSAYGVYNAFHPKIKNIEVEIENLPAPWKNKTIVHLSDIHLGHVHKVGFLESVVRKVNSLNPDLVFITGDLFDGMSGRLTHFIEPLNSLEAQAGIFYVTGNHETYLGLSRALEVLEKTKINILRNQVVELNGLQVVGIGYPGLDGTKDTPKLIEFRERFAKDKPSILLFHTPTNICQIKEDDFNSHFNTYWLPDASLALNKEIGISLQLSGHTHRGQIFPFGYLTKLIYKGYDYGLHKEGRFSIYTTSGVGTWGPPMRTGSSPEIAVIRLR